MPDAATAGDADTKTTGIEASAAPARGAATTSSPSMRGIMKSSRMSAGRELAAVRHAEVPPEDREV